jgi:hypothetical protein
MRGFVLQDWITVQGDTTTNNIVQSPSDWADVEPYQDAVLFLETRSGSAGFLLETAPSADESLFKPVLAQITMVPSATPSVSKILLANATSTFPPISRWMRWHVTSLVTSTWTVTFRVSLAVNAAMGMAG